MKRWIYPISAVVAIVAFLTSFFYINDPYHIVDGLMVVLLTLFLRCGTFKFSLIDGVILLIGLYMMLLPTVNPCLSVQSLLEFSGNIVFYFLLRFLFTQNNNSKFLLCVTFCILIFSLLACSSFHMFQRTIHDLAFESWYDFRFLYAPLGVPNNEWNSLQWLFGGIVAATYLYSSQRAIQWLAIFTGGLVLFLALISFSRGFYITVFFVFIIGIVLIGKRIKKSSVYSLIIFYAFIAIGTWMFYSKETSKLIRFNDTVSQQRSISGRVNALRLTDEILDDFPWGVGMGNYVVAKDYYLTGEMRSETYTSYAPNTFVKIFVEGGYVGISLYSLLIISGCIYLIRKRDHNKWLITLFLIGFILQEFSFSTILDSVRVQMTALFLIAFIQKEKDYIFSSSPILVQLLPCLGVLGVCFAVCFRAVNPEQAQMENPLDVKQIFDRSIERSNEQEMKTMANNYPDKIWMRWALFSYYKRNQQTSHAVEELTRCILQNPRIMHTTYWKECEKKDTSFAKQVKDCLAKAINEYSDNPIVLAKYGSIALELGYIEKSDTLLHKAADQLPNLSRTWLNLSIIRSMKGEMSTAALYRKRAHVLEHGIFTKHSQLTFDNQTDVHTLVNQNKLFLQHIWYGEMSAHGRSDTLCDE